MLNWILIIFIWAGNGMVMSNIRVSSKESCENIGKQIPKSIQLPSSLGKTFQYICVEDK